MPYSLVKKRFHAEARKDTIQGVKNPKSYNNKKNVFTEKNILGSAKSSCDSGNEQDAKIAPIQREKSQTNFGVYMTTPRLVPIQQQVTKTSAQSDHSSGSDQSLSLMTKPGYITSKRLEGSYKRVQSLYDSEKAKADRESAFLEKYTTRRAEIARERIKQQHKRDWKRLKDRERIHEELLLLRIEFEMCKADRVRTQYVTSKLLEHEKNDRDTFEQKISGEINTQKPKLRKKIPKLSLDEEKIKESGKLNHCQYMFNINYPSCYTRITPPIFLTDADDKRGKMRIVS